MISDSVPWKHELLKIAQRLTARTSQRQRTERTSFLIERDVMVGAYIIRKLIDTPGKISDEAISHEVEIASFPLIGEPPDFWDAYDFWKHYDMETSTDSTLSLRGFTNQVIHSFAWCLTVDESSGAFNGILVCSDRQSKSAILFLAVEELVKVFELIGSDNVARLHMQRRNGRTELVRASNRISDDYQRDEMVATHDGRK